MWVQSDGMEDGRWKMDDGRWTMEDGRWKMEGGASTRRIVCNLPHPRGVPYERAHNNEQKINTAYAQRFRQEDAAKSLTAEGLAARIKDPKEREHYVEAFRRSDFEAMLNYYKQNYPAPP